MRNNAEKISIKILKGTNGESIGDILTGIEIVVLFLINNSDLKTTPEDRLDFLLDHTKGLIQKQAVYERKTWGGETR